MTVDDLKAEYAPYHTMPAFDRGFSDYQHGQLVDADGVDGQAYDRGAEAAMRWQHQQDETLRGMNALETVLGAPLSTEAL